MQDGSGNVLRLRNQSMLAPLTMKLQPNCSPQGPSTDLHFSCRRCFFSLCFFHLSSTGDVVAIQSNCCDTVSEKPKKVSAAFGHL